MAQCSVEMSNEELNRGKLRGVAVSIPERLVCRPLFEMGIPAPFCPFDPDQKANCPLAQAARREIPVIEGIRKFYDMAPCLKITTV